MKPEEPGDCETFEISIGRDRHGTWYSVVNGPRFSSRASFLHSEQQAIESTIETLQEALRMAKGATTAS